MSTKQEHPLPVHVSTKESLGCNTQFTSNDLQRIFFILIILTMKNCVLLQRQEVVGRKSLAGSRWQEVLEVKKKKVM
ncbi:hypothetical protein EYF80_067780 [Liparis tanakae]|uniref:Uncharacterized protein n=1 Tax=Liparis tanakae TaxID=230148 RepID=A0A4Z2E067_9TELE|nr:hypothetical protein EYF80_067780 [Liparis tanakae]